MLNWILAILRQLPVRHRLGLVIGIILAPTALTTFVLVKAVDEADRTLGQSIERTVDDLMPVANLEAKLEQARFELERSITTGENDTHHRLSDRIDDDFDGMLAHHDLPPSLTTSLRNAFVIWRKVSPILDRALAARSPSALSPPDLSSSELNLAQTVAMLDGLRTQLLNSIKKKYVRERWDEHLFDILLIIVWTAGLLATAAAVYLLSTSILRPLREISRAAVLLRNGDFAFKLSVAGKDEFTAVAAAFNAMAATIQESHERLYDSSLRDPLTGVLNRRGLDAALAQSFAHGDVFSIIIMDVDHFKDINDRFGHRAGDEALTELAQCMVSVTRGGDSISRYGGDEFVIVLPGADSRAAERLARRFVSNLRQVNDGRAFPIQVSIGIAQKTRDHHRPELLIEAADRALYEAKNSGRGRIHIAHADSRP